MKTVVISDIHNYIENAQYILDTESADEYVLLGDIFDNFGDENRLDIVRRTAEWLKDILRRNNVKVIWGNHDVPYRWLHNRYVRCPGFTHEKCRMINSILSFDDWEKLHWYVKTQDWYLSHAGLCPEVFCHPIEGFQDWYIDETIKKGIDFLQSGKDPIHCRMGFRMGVPQTGGMTWADWNEFKPTWGINQIVGHTPDGFVRVKYLKKWKDTAKEIRVVNKFFEDEGPKEDKILSLNYCIDTASHHYAVIENGKVTIKENEIRKGKSFQS